MRLIEKLILLIVIVGILLGASAYVILYTDDNDNNNNGGDDNEPPQIIDITGNQTVPAGQTITITVQFTDNVNVTEATLYYKTADATNWTQTSILSTSVPIEIPESATSDYYYYVIVNDAADNGPVGAPSSDGSVYYIITVSSPETLVHTVFIEEATAVWCTNCPSIANILHELYQSKTYNFYYVSLIDKANTQTNDRLSKDYNIFGYPTVFIDGGYKVLFGADNTESDFVNAIQEAKFRTAQKIKLTVSAEYLNATQEVVVNAWVENRGNETYRGNLKIYLTEIVSHLSGYDSKPYAYGFLEYLMVQDISLDANTKETYSKISDISAYDYENLMIIAVVFNSEKHTTYANPRTNENAFDAYFADATNATLLVEGGNLPPELLITSPQKGKIYLSGTQILGRLQQRKILGFFLNNSLHNKTVLLGKKIIITVDATDDSAVAKVEFYIDGTRMATDTTAPYEYTFIKDSLFRSFFAKEHTLMVTVYDDTGKTTSSNILFKAHM
jgi:thiol-disulfide isomerase/thioredoxin